MTDVEREIIEYLKQNREAYFARKEISRKAKEPRGVRGEPPLGGGAAGSARHQGYVVQNDSGHYKLSETYDG